jgi:nifR3 family TIM-barrel protein
MAGVTNPPFRRLCREYAESVPRLAGLESREVDTSGLYVAEMVTARAVVERNPRALRIVTFDDDEPVKSAQIYGVDPKNVGIATSIMTEEFGADHIDLNFGCPVPKVTRKGGGGALPWKTDLFTSIVGSAVRAAPAGVPVTVKMRIGIDDEHETFRDAAQAAVNQGASAITFHARTVAQRYSGVADWSKIADLVEMDLGVPVFGNGDVFSGDDARRMHLQTNCDAVAIGRGCLGRPWLFADLIAERYGSEYRHRPNLSEIKSLIIRHVELLTDYYQSEVRATKELRKHIAWYLRGFPVGGEVRNRLMLVSNHSQLRAGLSELENMPYPDAADGVRGRQGGAKRPILPDGWLNSRQIDDTSLLLLDDGDLDDSGG